LADWLSAHHFAFPKEKQAVLDRYIQQHWFFVAVRINPEGNGFVVKSKGSSAISAATRQKLASGELHPIIISFSADKCTFPLAISSLNGTPSEISLYVVSAQPLLSSVIFERKLEAYKTEKQKSLGFRDSIKRSRQDMRAKIFHDSPLAAKMNGEDPNDPP